jgi:hypothetical protein
MLYRMMIAFAFVALLGFIGSARAADTKSVTLKGTLECAKCVLHEGKACQTVLMVKDGDKTTEYYLVSNQLAKDSHGAVCKTAKENVSVTGTVEEKDGKHWLTADKIEGLGD